MIIETPRTARFDGSDIAVAEHHAQTLRRIDISTFVEDERMFSSARLFLQLKGFNRQERLGRRSQQLKHGESGSPTDRSISDGAIFVFDTLGESTHLEQLNTVNELTTQDSRGVAFAEDRIFVGSMNQLQVIDKNTWSMKNVDIHSEWLAFIHSLCISPSGTRMLVVSSGFDRIIEIGIHNGQVTREWIAWENGFNRSKKDGTLISSRRSLGENTANQITIESPADYGSGLGLPPNLRTAFPNSACYVDDDIVLATLFHHGLVRIDLRTGSTRVIDERLVHAHSVCATTQGFMLTNTGAGEVIFYDEEYARTRIFDFSKMPGLAEAAEGREWLQHVSFLGDGAYLAVDSNRASLFFLDENARTFRRIAYPSNWVIQEAHLI